MDVAESYEISVCVDCLMLAANGEVFDGDGVDVSAAHADMVDYHWPAGLGWQVVPNCPEECDEHFSMAACEGCGSALGGDRHDATAIRTA